jgi:hypothetical protein
VAKRLRGLEGGALRPVFDCKPVSTFGDNSPKNIGHGAVLWLPMAPSGTGEGPNPSRSRGWSQRRGGLPGKHRDVCATRRTKETAVRRRSGLRSPASCRKLIARRGAGGRRQGGCLAHVMPEVFRCATSRSTMGDVTMAWAPAPAHTLLGVGAFVLQIPVRETHRPSIRRRSGYRTSLKRRGSRPRSLISSLRRSP